jgi:CheY-like chemotaxis protein
LARRILLADDSVTAQNMGRRILTDAGYEVITVNNGSAALKKIAEQRPDLIVLDVYMPGYGGLEVCQRIKESQETARIPVLLTVGKLEPFKPDEARRVRADAFIVKPFEATELLTALTRLEDKIVAQPQPQKTGRFAKALAAVEQSETGERFGDRETGWKSRLIIPDPNASAKPAEAEAPEAVAVSSAAPAPAEPLKASEPTREFERPIPAGLPADITPEEIAAITAAAAAFSGASGPSAAGPDIAPPAADATQETVAASPVEATPETTSTEAAPVSAIEPEAPAVTLAAMPEAAEKSLPEAPAEATPAAPEAVAQTATSETTKVEDVPVPAEVPAASAEAEPATRPASEIPAPETEKPAGDAEVMAAIASLAPGNGHAAGSVPFASETAPKAGEEAAAAVASIAGQIRAAGPRWIAELVAATSAESALSLENEMQQAQTPAAVAQAAAPGPAAESVVESTVPASAAGAGEPAAVASDTGTSETIAGPETAAVAEAIPVAEVAVAAQSVSAPVAAEAAGIEVSSAQGTQPVVAREEAAYAAAAAASSTAGPAHTVDSATPTPALPESSESLSAAPAPQREAELQAAWQNWKQIRESYAGAQPSSQAAESPAVTAEAPAEDAVATAKAVSEETVSESAEVEEAASDTPAEPTEIASIVDSMLAELRPKLVAEIAKKMGSEKKDRQKEKDRKKKK